MSLKKIDEIYSRFSGHLKSVSSKEEIQKIRTVYLGKKSELNSLFSLIPTMEEELRKKFGQKINDIRKKISDIIEVEEKKVKETQLSQYASSLKVDYNLPGYRNRRVGKKHPLQIVQDEVVSVMKNLGFTLVDSVELEEDFYNFEALNIYKNHPARDAQDSFFIDENHLLRTHTTAVDVRLLEQKKLPFALVCPGRTYRRDAIDATHYPVFHQIDALYVDKGLKFSHLKSLVYEMCYKLFDKNIEIRFRPDYFPFTEPSCEISIRSKKGNSKWLEILGCGMFHPDILERFEIDSTVYKGIAFGVGIERLVMLKYGIEDIRVFFENDYSFLEQFS